MNIVDRFVDVAGFRAHVDGLAFNAWRPSFVVVHNTSSPDLALYRQWRARGPSKWTPEQWGRNLASYYAGMGWRSGPHAFVCPDGILLFSPLTAPGTHSPAWNNRTWGIETVGEFDREPFAGSASETNLIAALGILHLAAGLDPGDYKFGAHGLHFHKEDPVTTHKDCPGRNVNKAKLIRDVLAYMHADNPNGHAEVPAHVQGAETIGLTERQLTSVAWLQKGLCALGYKVDVDGIAGDETKAAVKSYQQQHGLVVDGIGGPLTRASIEADLAKLAA